MKRPAADTGVTAAGGGGADSVFAKKHPLLWAMLTDTQWDDGGARDVSAISLFVEDGRWKGALNDKDLRRSAYVTADSPQAVLLTLEDGLRSNQLDWRSWGKSTKKKG